MKLIPAIDLLDGKCVRLSQGDYRSSKTYSEHPLEVAKAMEAAGIRCLHLVDLDGARSSRMVNHKILQEIASKTSLEIDFGGGLKRTEDVAAAFDYGASQVTIGTIAITDPDLFGSWLQHYGPAKIILGADCRNRKPAAQGWQQTTASDIVTFIRNYHHKGVMTVTCTDIDKDGMLQGPSTGLYREILETVPVQLIASGGITSLQDLHILQQAGCYAAIIGKAIYEGSISLQQLSTLC
jgi:phosphoribosylformimino-5-aminoimidazole carboxamide ribotide isomerase